ncbi:Gfo/Idh/MocA family oxidoreductase [Roseomonas gilardii subsp. gilardii]|uniref:Gfo/Idh/MocA family protein n=1 Tax=Roseomonas gilardii TaxID=257708 RepID=UPI001FF9821E|nr:Gfo/Idh/MocA family oxidoreductase [Roseomonas gilardii]UPG73004.1 Gfo/Idh/MocA family oxidoreductase [Roseomonas gilardii subsp. gilardii]
MGEIRLGLVGLGKIARDQHLPAIAATPGIALAGIASRNAGLPDLPSFPTLEALLASGTPIDAVALCTPPQGRHALAAQALAAGKHVLLEKPPGATLAEIGPLQEMARRKGLTLFATWHSRFAPVVEPLRERLAGQRIRSLLIQWKEDVRVWHPGQEWIWEPGGLGVFDPGINALSILTRILPFPVFLTGAELSFPANRAAPIAAALRFGAAHDAMKGGDFRAEFDWRQTGPQSWDIHLETDTERLTLSRGGARLERNGELLLEAPEAEYRGIYRHFVDLIRQGGCDVDLSPMIHVADAFMLGQRNTVEAFHEA